MQTVTETKPLTADEFHAARRFADTDFGRIAYVERGRGPVALFVHGALLNGYQWRHQLAGLTDLRRLVAVDVMGMGYTEAKPDQALGLNEQAEMFSAVLDSLELGDSGAIDLVGSDSGGGMAQAFAATHPERIRTLTLTNCEVDDFDDQTPAFVQFRQLVQSGGLPALLRAGLENPSQAKAALASAYEHPERLPDEAIDIYFRPLVSSKERVRQLLAFVSENPREELVALRGRLKALTAPVQVLWGTADTFFRLEDALWLRDNLPNLEELVEIEGAPVFWPEERPELLNEKLRAFWSRHQPAT